MPSHRQPPTQRSRGSRSIKAFDPKEFLANAGIGRTIHEYRGKQAIFSQGQSSDAVYYIQEGKVRLSVLSKQGKEATIALLGPGDFLGEGCIASDQPSVWQPLLRLRTAPSYEFIRKRCCARSMRNNFSLTCSLLIWLNGTTALRQT